MRAHLVVVLCLLATMAVAAPGAAQADHDLEIVALSNRADLVSGDDVLLEVRLPDGVNAEDVRVDVDGRDVTSAFAVREDGRFMGLVEGLVLGHNTIRARARTRPAQLEVVNHPVGGPIFSGPQIQPWYCLPDALDAQCNRETTFSYQYKSSVTGGFAAYDPAWTSPPADLATTTTDEGETVPYIVRIEAGNLNRGQYRIAVLTTPEEEWTRWTGPAAWNHKVYSPHGAGCSMGHTEAPPPPVLDDLALSRGHAVLSVGMADNNYVCNVAVQAESVMMAKEHLIETYGDVRFAFGSGGSGGSMEQLLIANAYPGLYDGLIVNATFPDVPINDLVDCPLLLRYWESPTAWAPGVVWTEPQEAAAAGQASTSVCQVWVKAYPYPRMFDPTVGAGCMVGEPEVLYNAQSNPTGVRCSFQDYLVNIFGVRPQERWGPVEQNIGAGFANRPYDNVGVQYGLRALLSGDITTAQFVDLNAKVGAFDIDYGWQPGRVEADPGALAAAYRSGVVNEANNLDRVAIIDIPGTFPGDRYEIHDNYKSWALRARLDAANGHHDNHVMWYGSEGPFQDRFGTMDAWLTAVESDNRDVPVEQKVAENRPDLAQDICYYPDDGPICNELFGPAANPRWGAGGSIANDVVKCQLEPLVRSDYFPILFSDAEWETLNEAFPTGLCDWSRAGVGQQPAIGWQTYAGGPGGQSLGVPPVSAAADSPGG